MVNTWCAVLLLEDLYSASCVITLRTVLSELSAPYAMAVALIIAVVVVQINQI